MNDTPDKAACPVSTVRWAASDAILDVAYEAAECSHRPENVRRWLDANSRNRLAVGVLEALGIDPEMTVTELRACLTRRDITDCSGSA